MHLYWCFAHCIEQAHADGGHQMCRSYQDRDNWIPSHIHQDNLTIQTFCECAVLSVLTVKWSIVVNGLYVRE